MKQRQKILQDQTWDDSLFDQGFVVIPFLEPGEIDTLKDFYWTCHPTKQEGFFSSAHMPDPIFRDRVNKGVKAVFERANNETLADCRTLGGSFIAKGPGESGHLQPHQDWNIVDESKYRSFNIWVPLVDVGRLNGAVSVISGSHEWTKSFRGANIKDAWNNTYPILWKHMQLLEMKAGEALVYDHRLLHGSQPNYSEEMRMVAVYGIMPEAADMYYYYAENEHIAEYKCDPEFYINANPFDGPGTLEKHRDLPYHFPEFNHRDVASFLGIELPKPATATFWERLVRIFR
ncbi:MAG: phytanoyl-CoA dioxygenase family protein [Bacteroidota bacterium]